MYCYVQYVHKKVCISWLSIIIDMVYIIRSKYVNENEEKKLIKRCWECSRSVDALPRKNVICQCALVECSVRSIPF